MRRAAPPLLLLGAFVLACGGSNASNGTDAPADVSTSVCGDGICAPDELLSCQVDCGAEGNPGSGSDGSGSDGSGSGSGSGIMGGSGSGSGTPFCMEKIVEEECFLCIGADICQGSGISIGVCLACAIAG